MTLYQKKVESDLNTQTQRRHTEESHVKTETEAGVMQLQAKSPQG